VSDDEEPVLLSPLPPSQADVLAWVATRWPHHATTERRALKFGEEAGEVLGAVIKESVGQKTKADIATEAAQAQLCLMALAESVGFDLRQAVLDEWQDCATRVWEGTQ
jgi:NTP pyrophosphatase (non-canonical NTP hydrolase)